MVLEHRVQEQHPYRSNEDLYQLALVSPPKISTSTHSAVKSLKYLVEVKEFCLVFDQKWYQANGKHLDKEPCRDCAK